MRTGDGLYENNRWVSVQRALRLLHIPVCCSYNEDFIVIHTTYQPMSSVFLKTRGVYNVPFLFYNTPLYLLQCQITMR